jgi:hypothetical protein
MDTESLTLLRSGPASSPCTETRRFFVSRLPAAVYVFVFCPICLHHLISSCHTDQTSRTMQHKLTETRIRLGFKFPKLGTQSLCFRDSAAFLLPLPRRTAPELRPLPARSGRPRSKCRVWYLSRFCGFPRGTRKRHGAGPNSNGLFFAKRTHQVYGSKGH